MDQAAALLSALQAAASLGDANVDPSRVEALAGALGLEREGLPALVSQLQKAGKVAIGWGGIVEALPEQGAGASVVFNQQGANFGPWATFAGRDAHGTTIQITPERALGALAAVIASLQTARPNLHEEAATAADRAIEALKAQPSAEAPPEERRQWMKTVKAALGGLAGLLALAPQLKDAVELGEDALKGLGWG
jgi:hypothetical protein